MSGEARGHTVHGMLSTAHTDRRFVTPLVREILDPRTGRPATVAGFRPPSQRDLVVASLLRVPVR